LVRERFELRITRNVSFLVLMTLIALLALSRRFSGLGWVNAGLRAQETPTPAHCLFLPVVLRDCPPANRTYALVTRVADGDTIEIEGGQRVRYIGINAPELSETPECYGPEAYQKNRELVENRVVALERDVSEVDHYGRLLRYVYVDGCFVNAELIRLGYARAMPIEPNLRYQELFAALEEEARQAGRGLWTACPTPTPPLPGPTHLLISEVFYDTPGTDANEEWIELYNPTNSIVNLWLYRLGDEETRDGTEGMYQFPDGAVIGPGARIVLARKATGFRVLYGFNPDFEFVDSDDVVPDMSQYLAWASGILALNNEGDEVILLDSAEAAVDVVTYEEGHWPDHVPHPGVETSHSLERWPADGDTNDCSQDFMDQPNPNPGE
jgi:micrococcal nuclease